MSHAFQIVGDRREIFRDGSLYATIAIIYAIAAKDPDPAIKRLSER